MTSNDQSKNKNEHLTDIIGVRRRWRTLIQIQFYCTCSQKAKNKKAKQAIMHCTSKTIQNKKWNAVQWKKGKKQQTKESDIGLLVFYEGVMNKRFVAVSTVTGSRIRGWFFKPRCDLSVTRGWQQMMIAIRWIKQFAENIVAKFVVPIWERRKLSINRK